MITDCDLLNHSGENYLILSPVLTMMNRGKNITVYICPSRRSPKMRYNALWTLAFGDTVANLGPVVSHSYHGMPRRQISMHVTPKNSIGAI